MNAFATIDKTESKQNAGNSFFGNAKNSTPFIQPKLTVNQPNDVYEQEADAMADKVMRMETPMLQTKTNDNSFFKPTSIPVTAIQRKCTHCEEEEKKMQRKEMNDAKTTADNNLENYVGNLNSTGQPLPNEVSNFYEPRFGYDFSNVKIHTNNVAAKSAESINALAYTSGNNIVFNKGQYSPNTESGKRLLGHELTHVVQQSSNASTSINKKNERSIQKKNKEDCKFSKITTSTVSNPPGVKGGIDSSNIFIVINWCKGDNKGDIKLGVDVPATIKRIGDKIVNAAINGNLDQLGNDLKTEDLNPFVDILLNKGGFSLTAHGEISVGLKGVSGGKGDITFSKGPVDIEGNITKDEQGLQGGIKVTITPGRKDTKPDCKTKIIPLKVLCECKLQPQSVDLKLPPLVLADTKEVFIYFPYWSYDINKAKKDPTVKALNDISMPLLEQLVGDEYKVAEISGYTSPEGSLEKINTKLSQDRADAVKAYIEQICKPKSMLAMRSACDADVVKNLKPLGKNELYGSDEEGNELGGKKLEEHTVKQFLENEQESGRTDEAFMKSLEKLTTHQKADRIYPRLRRVRVVLKKINKLDKPISLPISSDSILKDCPPEIANSEKLKFMLTH
jgi:hypothetical protein